MTDTRFPDGLDIGNDAGVAGTLKIGGTAITATPAELNQLAGIGGAALAYTAAGKKLFAGTVVVPSGSGGTAFKPTGAASINFIVAAAYGPIAGTDFERVAATVGSGGTVTIRGYAPSLGGTVVVSAASGTASYLAIGS